MGLQYRAYSLSLAGSLTMIFRDELYVNALHWGIQLTVYTNPNPFILHGQNGRA